jgi:hypothetical protein
LSSQTRIDLPHRVKAKDWEDIGCRGEKVFDGEAGG